MAYDIFKLSFQSLNIAEKVFSQYSGFEGIDKNKNKKGFIFRFCLKLCSATGLRLIALLRC